MYRTLGPYNVRIETGLNSAAIIQVEAFSADGNRTMAMRIDGTCEPQFYAGNARLFAAAPDLLAALEEMYRHGVQAFGEDFDVMLTARSAIARATGAA